MLVENSPAKVQVEGACGHTSTVSSVSFSRCCCTRLQQNQGTFCDSAVSACTAICPYAEANQPVCAFAYSTYAVCALQVPLLKGLSDNDLLRVAGRMPERVYADSEALIRYGERGDEMYLIRYGKVGTRTLLRFRVQV